MNTEILKQINNTNKKQQMLIMKIYKKIVNKKKIHLLETH